MLEAVGPLDDGIEEMARNVIADRGNSFIACGAFNDPEQLEDDAVVKSTLDIVRLGMRVAAQEEPEFFEIELRRKIAIQGGSPELYIPAHVAEDPSVFRERRDLRQVLIRDPAPSRPPQGRFARVAPPPPVTMHPCMMPVQRRTNLRLHVREGCRPLVVVEEGQ